MRTVLRRVLADNWQRRGILSYVLWPLSLLYGLLVTVRRWLYRAGMLASAQVPVPVIVVGNVVAGGGGKTPMALAIVRHLQERGHRPGVVSRGYGRGFSDCRQVLDVSAPSEVGDEPLLIRRATGAPVFVAPRRIDAARALLRQHPEVDLLVCDDGLQHHALRRDMEVCVFDPRGMGNGWLIPAGPLRERWPRQVDMVVANGWTAARGIWPVRRTLAPCARQADGTELPLTDLASRARAMGSGLWAVAGIAHPESFFAMLGDAGLSLARTTALPDHAAFDDPSWQTHGTHTLICTEKDAVKLWHVRPDAWAVPLQLELGVEFWAEFDDILMARSGGKLSSPHGHKTA